MFKDITNQRFGRLIVLQKSKTVIYGGKPFITWSCLCDCGSKLDVAGSSLRSKNTKSCGCFKKDKFRKMASYNRGEKHYKYNKNLTEEERYNKERRSQNHHTWSLDIKKIYGFKCFICKVTKDLISHHLESFSENKTLRYDLNNGVCLCSNHHKMLHSVYGNKVKKQNFNDFYIINFLLTVKKLKENNITLTEN